MSTPSGQTFAGLLDILAGHASVRQMKFVSFSGQLTLQQTQSLADAIKISATQEGVRLKGCLLRDAGAELLAAALAGNSKLETLELPGNDIGLRGAQALAACFPQNTILTTLDLTENPCELGAPKVLEAIGKAVHKNRGLPPVTSPTSHLPSQDATSAALDRNVPLFNLSNLSNSGTSARTGMRSSNKENLVSPVSPGAGPNATSTDSINTRTSTAGSPEDLGHRMQRLERSAAVLDDHIQQLQSCAGLVNSHIRQLGSSSGVVKGQVEHVQGELTQIAEWKQQVDNAGQQFSAVLELVQDQQHELRHVVREHSKWVQQVDGSTEMPGQSFNDMLMRESQRCLMERVEDLQQAVVSEADRADEGWTKCERELEDMFASVEGVKQAQQEAADDIIDLDVESRLQSLEQAHEQVLEHTDQLEIHIKIMLQDLIKLANQEQLRLKVEHEKLVERVLSLEVRCSSSTSGGSCTKTPLRAINKPGAADIGSAQGLTTSRRSPAGPSPSSLERAVQKLTGRISALESGLADAVSFAEAERVRSQQTEAILDNLSEAQKDLSDVLAEHDDALAAASPLHALHGTYPPQQLPLSRSRSLPQLSQRPVPVPRLELLSLEAGPGRNDVLQQPTQQQQTSPPASSPDRAGATLDDVLRQQQQLEQQVMALAARLEEQEVCVLRDVSNEQQVQEVSQHVCQQGHQPDLESCGEGPAAMGCSPREVGRPASTRDELWQTHMAAELQCQRTASTALQHQLQQQETANTALQQRVEQQAAAISSLQAHLAADKLHSDPSCIVHRAVQTECRGAADRQADIVGFSDRQAETVGAADRHADTASGSDLQPGTACASVEQTDIEADSDRQAASERPSVSDRQVAASEEHANVHVSSLISRRSSDINHHPGRTSVGVALTEPDGPPTNGSSPKSAPLMNIVAHDESSEGQTVSPAFRFFRTINKPYRFL